MGEAARKEETLPEPSAALSVLGVLVDVWLEEMPEKKRRRVIERITAQSDWLASSGSLVRLRCPSQDQLASIAHTEAAAWWRRLVTTWIGRPR